MRGALQNISTFRSKKLCLPSKNWQTMVTFKSEDGSELGSPIYGSNSLAITPGKNITKFLVLSDNEEEEVSEKPNSEEGDKTQIKLEKTRMKLEL